MATFRTPRFDAPVDLEANLRALPPNACCRGMYFNDLLTRAKSVSPTESLAALAGIPERRYVAFLEYPYGDILRFMVAAASVVHPDLPQGEGIRRLGQHAYDALLGSHAGRVIFGVLGLDAEQVLMHGASGYRLALNFGKVTTERLGERHVAYRFEGLPIFLETFQVGVIEGALAHCKVRGDVRVAMTGLSQATFDITWR